MSSQVDTLVLNIEHLRVLSSVACNEVMSAFNAFVPMSAKDVAEIVVKSPASVSEHIHKLVGVGLLIEAGMRKKRSRVETLYLPAGKVIRFQVQGQPPEALDAYMDRVRGKLKLTERNFSELLKAVPEDESVADFLIYKTYTASLDRERALRLKIATDELLNVLKSFEQHGVEDEDPGRFVRYDFMAVGLPSSGELRRTQRRRRPGLKS